MRLVLLLLPALLLAQWMGFAHAVSHARLGAPAAVAAPANLPEAKAAGPEALYAGHEAVTCRLLDQLSHGDALPCIPPQLPPAVHPGFAVTVPPGRLVVVATGPFEARAPPVLR